MQEIARKLKRSKIFLSSHICVDYILKFKVKIIFILELPCMCGKEMDFM